jgi:hypothetical protein
MIANFNERTEAAISETGMRNALAQRQEVHRGSLVERVCSFLEQYPLSLADGAGAPSLSIGATALFRPGDDRGEGTACR